MNASQELRMNQLDAPGQIYLWCEGGIRATRDFGWRLGRIISAVYSGIFLGLLDTPRALDTVTGTHYARFGKRYTESDWNRSGLKQWERDVVDTSFANLKSVIVTSAGGGREVLALAQRGLQVSAFECTQKFRDFCATMLEEAGVEARIVAAAPGEVPDVGLHDGIVVGWGSYMHIPGSAARIDFLRRLRAQVALGGPLLVSCELRKTVERRSKVIAAIAAFVRRLRGTKSSVEVGDEMMGWYCHVFTEDELRSEFEKGGFRLEFTSVRGYGHAVGIAV